MNDFEMRLGAMLSMCCDMAKGIVGGDQFAITLICRSRFTPGHILIGDDQAPTLIRAIEELDRFGKKMLVNGEEQEEVEHTAADRMAALLQEAGERFREYEKHHRDAADVAEAGIVAGARGGRDHWESKATDRNAKAEANAEIAARIEALLAEVGFAPDPDDAPELTEEIASRAQISEAGEIIRPATGTVTKHFPDMRDKPE